MGEMFEMHKRGGPFRDTLAENIVLMISFIIPAVLHIEGFKGRRGKCTVI